LLALLSAEDAILNLLSSAKRRLGASAGTGPLRRR
jgi:hypothetical protein